MIASIKIAAKGFGSNELYKNLEISLEAGEKVGLIGRNGTGKSTLFNLMSGLDTDFDGQISLGKNIVMVSSRQEHHGFEETTVLEYILADLPEYAKLKHILETYPETMGDSTQKMQKYSDSLERFTDLGYYEVENDVNRALSDYQLEIDINTVTLGSLSGGQKRMVELVKVQRARADLALIDEPTNHMDYIAKASFVNWFKSTKEAVVVITHDRDVLGVVDRIIEIRDGKAFSFKGNYKDYLRSNTQSMSSEVNEFENTQRRIANLKNDIVRFRRFKERARDPGTIQRFKSLETKSVKELSELQNLEKPTFWIDRESASELGTKISESYENHKARNIRVRTKTAVDKSERVLLKVDNVSLGYGESALFQPVSFELRIGGKVELKGRNGAGKTTLVGTILDSVAEKKPVPTVFTGVIEHEKKLRIGVYEQEISSDYLEKTLSDAIESMHLSRGLPITDEKIKQLLSDYLFNPHADGGMKIGRLSGGQKARFQLISMLAGDPQILVLDEPTNHLDLPSIEELEDALKQYHGSILYISHDTYFTQSLGGTVVEVRA
ncbi:ABC-F family ATP-binding cassette domain-containing protein [Candidatus Saccharibacteria bacterium]|nr:ABC-F family ATP-binding cassette domain-containing protein [Candidatus Saccharibacteria bacterium]